MTKLNDFYEWELSDLYMLFAGDVLRNYITINNPMERESWQPAMHLFRILK